MSFSQGVINKLIIKFKQEKPDLTDNQILFYINEFDKMKASPKISEKDIMKYSFSDLEKLIDSFPKKVNKSLTGLNNIDSNDIIYDENNLLILKGDTKDKCIRYGRGYSWCISRQDSSNMFNTYRYRYDEINFYFVFDKDKSDTDVNRALVILVDKNHKFYLANASNSGDFAGTKEFTFKQITEFQPKLNGLQDLFKPLPLTSKEKDTHNKIKNEISNDNLMDYFNSYDMIEAYISFGHELTDIQYVNISDDLKSKYINLGNILTDNQLSNTNIKLIERYDNLHSLQTWLDNKYSKEEQRNLTILYCSYNNLTSLKGIENLTNLTILNCYNNNLTSLNGIENLTNLTELNCTYNKLTSLKGIENLTNLKELDCSDNNLTSLNGIENLTNLTILYCSNNKLRSLKGIENLTNLTILNCSFNNLPKEYSNKNGDEIIKMLVKK